MRRPFCGFRIAFELNLLVLSVPVVEDTLSPCQPQLIDFGRRLIRVEDDKFSDAGLRFPSLE